jgi:hypothetical protein
MNRQIGISSTLETNMKFAIRLILPEQNSASNPVCAPRPSKSSELIDDNPDSPVFLYDACAAFDVNGVRFEIDGFFTHPLPLSAEGDFHYFLEDLPGLIEFLIDDLSKQFKVGLGEQGIETGFLFLRLDPGTFEVQCSSLTARPMRYKAERISRPQLVSQILTVVDGYKEGLKRYFPDGLKESWSQELFKKYERLKNKPVIRVGDQ